MLTALKSRVQQMKSLGLIIDDNLKWQNRINAI